MVGERVGMCAGISFVCVCKPAGKSSVMIGGGGNQFKEAAGKQLNCLEEKLIFLSDFQGLQSYK